jgi:ABC-type lipoprotein export system ATPase subunit
VLDGQPVAGLDEDRPADLRCHRLAFVFQAFNPIPVLTAAEHVAHPMTLKGLESGIMGMMRSLIEEKRVAFVIATLDPRVVAGSRRTMTLPDGRFVNAA